MRRRSHLSIRLTKTERLAVDLAASRMREPLDRRTSVWAREVILREAEALLKRDRDDW